MWTLGEGFMPSCEFSQYVTKYFTVSGWLDCAEWIPRRLRKGYLLLRVMSLWTKQFLAYWIKYCTWHINIRLTSRAQKCSSSSLQLTWFGLWKKVFMTSKSKIKIMGFDFSLSTWVFTSVTIFHIFSQGYAVGKRKAEAPEWGKKQFLQITFSVFL